MRNATVEGLEGGGDHSEVYILTTLTKEVGKPWNKTSQSTVGGFVDDYGQLDGKLWSSQRKREPQVLCFSALRENPGS